MFSAKTTKLCFPSNHKSHFPPKALKFYSAKNAKLHFLVKPDNYVFCQNNKFTFFRQNHIIIFFKKTAKSRLSTGLILEFRNPTTQISLLFIMKPKDRYDIYTHEKL